MTEHDKVVCGPSIEPLREWHDKGPRTLWMLAPKIRDAIEAHDALRAENQRLLNLLKVDSSHSPKIIAELSRLRSENERLRGEVQSLNTQLGDAYKAIGLPTVSSEPLHCYLQRHKDALKKAKCALVKAQRAYRIRHAPTSDLLDSYPTEYDETITTINSLNL